MELNRGLGHIRKDRSKGNQRHNIVFKHQIDFSSSLANTLTPALAILSSPSAFPHLGPAL